MHSQLEGPSTDYQIDFLVKLQRVLSEGEFVASYKFALLHAIADLCVERGDDSGSELRLTTDLIAEKFVNYYWRQVTPYLTAVAKSEPIVLHQATGKQASVLNLISRARDRFEGRLSAAMHDKKEWRSLVRRVQKVVEMMPLWKLQTVGRQKLPFLYGNDLSGPNEICLKPGIAYCFRKFYELVLDLVQAAWIRWIRQLKVNRLLLGEVADLTEFLFGSDRASLAAVKPLLADLQKGRCFDCKSTLKREGDVDHFIPWSKYPADLGHNFVLAHKNCNAAKIDKLAAMPHFEAWWQRNQDNASVLQERFTRFRVVHDLSTSETVALWAYQQAAHAGALLWLKEKRLVEFPQSWMNHIAGLQRRAGSADEAFSLQNEEPRN